MRRRKLITTEFEVSRLNAWIDRHTRLFHAPPARTGMKPATRLVLAGQLALAHRAVVTLCGGSPK